MIKLRLQETTHMIINLSILIVKLPSKGVYVLIIMYDTCYYRCKNYVAFAPYYLDMKPYKQTAAQRFILVRISGSFTVVQVLNIFVKYKSTLQFVLKTREII